MTNPDRIERPWPIIFICLIAFLGAAISSIMLVKTIVAGENNEGDLVSAGIGILLLIPFIGIYRMKKTGYYLYGIFFLVAQSISIMKATWTPIGLILPVILLIAFVYYFKELD